MGIFEIFMLEERAKLKKKNYIKLKSDTNIILVGTKV
jgi:hypothetical protein